MPSTPDRPLPKVRLLLPPHLGVLLWVGLLLPLMVGGCERTSQTSTTPTASPPAEGKLAETRHADQAQDLEPDTAEEQARDPSPDAALDAPPPVIRVCVQPFEEYDQELLDAAVRGVKYTYTFEVQVLDARPIPSEAYYPPRKRYRAERLLRWLNEHIGPDSDCQVVVGFTAHDISTTKGEHKDWGVLGLGELGGRSAVVSSHRTGGGTEPRNSPARRMVKMINHEIGHVLGLPHNTQPGCLMNDAEGTVKTIDAASGLLCEPTIEHIHETHGIELPRRESVDWTAIELRD
jgi:archaemetzincin